MESDIKKLKALSGAILHRFPLIKVQSWAENLAIFQRTRPVTFKDTNFEHDPDLIYFKKAFDEGFLKEIDILDQQSNIKLHAWFLQPQSKMPTIVYSYGNSANLSEGKYLMDSFAARGYGFIGWSYPGYEHSEGIPSEKNLYSGLKAVSDYLAFTYDIQPSSQIAMGHSLGGLVTVDVATKAFFQSIVLMATPSNIPDYYENLLKNVPVLIRWMCVPKERITQRFDALSKMPFVKCPVLFIYSDTDEETPSSIVEKLSFLSQTPSYEKMIDGAGHDFVEIPRFAEEICNSVCDTFLKDNK